MKVLDGKVLGVVGGMGPLATNIFYNMIIKKTEAKCDQDHINMIILNHATMPDRTEAIKNKDYRYIIKKMVSDVQFLEKAEVECIVIPCNTAHFMLDDIKKHTKTHIIDMIEEGVKKVEKLLSDKEEKKVGVLATTGTIEIGIYQKKLVKRGIEPIIPSQVNQEKVMNIIYDGIKKDRKINSDDFKEIVAELKDKGCEKILLACTELSVYKIEKNLGDDFIDAMEELAEKAIDICQYEKG